MKLLGITFKVLYFLLYIFLPCAIDVKCAESDAILNIWSFVLLDDNVQSYDEYKYNGINMYHRFHCDKSNFRFFLRRVVEETKELKNKNKDYIERGVRIDKRGKTFNKRVLVVNRDQIEIVLKELGDILGCQECPTILFCDICDKNNIKNNIINNDKDIQEEEKIDALREEKDNSKSDSLLNENFNIKDKKKDSSGAKDQITDYNALANFCSKYLKNDKREVDKERKNKPEGKCNEYIKEIFVNDKNIFGIITEYYSSNNTNKKSEIIETLFKLKEKIIKDIEILLGKEIKNIEDEENIKNKIKNVNDKINKATDNIISRNRLGHRILSYKAICKKYQQAEEDILTLDSKNINSLPGMLKRYIRWREILLQTQVIRTFIYFLGNEDIVKNNEGIIKKCINQKNIPDKFTENYNKFFFSDTFAGANYSACIEVIKNNRITKAAIRKFSEKNESLFHDDFSYDSFLDLFILYSKYETFITTVLPKEGIFKVLVDFLKNLEKGSLFAKKKSVLFKIVEIAASNGADFDKEVFYKLDKIIKNHFNSIIFKYLTDFLGRVKKNLEGAGGKGTTYDFHNANNVIEIIRVFSSYINTFLEKKKGRPELVYNAILLLMEIMKTLNMPSDTNSILMECSLVLNTLIEYFIYVKDFNDYVSKRSEEKQLALKKNAISNKLDSFCIIKEEDYNSLGSLDTSAPGIIKTVARRLYECKEDEHRNDPFFKIVVMGNMRAGKTLLIRNFFDEAERFKFKVANGDTSTTNEVRSYIRTYDGTGKYIQITDTPGFEGIKIEDRGYGAIDGEFDNLFKGGDTVVLDIVLFREGCINWLSENHKEIITRVLKETGNKIIFLIPFTSLRKNAKKIKEKFLASLFYNLYIKGEELPLNEDELKSDFKKFVERVIAIPINQLYREESKESRFGLIEMGETVKQCLSENKKDDKFFDSFIYSLPEDELCKEDEEDIASEKEVSDEEDEKEAERIKKEAERIKKEEGKKKKEGKRKNKLKEIRKKKKRRIYLERLENEEEIQELHEKNNKKDAVSLGDYFDNKEAEEKSEKEKIGSLKHLLLESLLGFNNFKLKIKDEELIQSEALPKIDKKCSWYHYDKESYELLNYVYLLYLGFSSFINQFCTNSYDPLLCEIHKTKIYRLSEFITSPYFFNYLCLDNENLNYNIFFFKEEIDLINREKKLEKILKKRESLAQFCLVADDQFLISEDDYKSIQELCAKFNKNYTCTPKAKEKEAMEKNYKEIRVQLHSYFEGKNDDIDTKFLDFVVCYDPTQRRYILDRTNLCFLGIELKMNEESNKLYEIIPQSLKDYIKNLNKAISGIERYDDFENKIKDKNNKILYERYHHEENKELIRKRERECINVVFKAIQEKKKKQQEEEEKNGGILGNIFTGAGNIFNLFKFRNNETDEVIKNNLRAWNNAT